MKYRKNVFIFGGLILIAIIVAALGFVLLLRPADSEYNNTIPAVMGILTIMSTIVTGLITLLNNQANHKENLNTLPQVIENVVAHAIETPKEGESNGG